MNQRCRTQLQFLNDKNLVVRTEIHVRLKKLAYNDPFNYWCQCFLISFAYYLSTVCKLANVILSTVSCISYSNRMDIRCMFV